MDKTRLLCTNWYFKRGTRQNDYIELEGVSSHPVNIRTYPLGEAAAHLTGYIGKVNAEELKSLQNKVIKQMI